MDESKWYGKRAAVLFASLLVAGMIGVSIFSMRDRTRRLGLEIVAQPTAVGERPGLKIHDGKIPTTVVATAGGTPLFAGAAETEKRKDCEMLKIAVDDTGVIGLFQPESGATGEGVFVKTDTDRYLLTSKLPPQPAQEPTPPPTP